VERLREEAPNLAGLKVSDRPFEAVEPYLLEGLAVFIGAEELAVRGLERGAAGVVSGLAAAYPDRMAELVRERSERLSTEVATLRRGFERFPYQAALKFVLARRGVPIREDVRAPLRGLTADERLELEQWLESS
jgi:dihydrodipicolinate synthase/N-acetylneuraminate lyase